MITVFERLSTYHNIATNYVIAGILNQSETNDFIEHLKQYTNNELLVVLGISRELKQNAIDGGYAVYPICLN